MVHAGVDRTNLENAVVIVEDDDGVRASLDILLRASGFETMLFEDAESFLAADILTPRCMLLDMNLPGQSGRHVLDAVRGKGVAVIVISARKQPTKELIDAGATAVLEKPVDIPRLMDLLKQIFA